MANESEGIDIPVDIGVFLTENLDVLAHIGITVPDETGEMSFTSLALDEGQLLFLIAALCKLHEMVKDVNATSLEQRQAAVQSYLIQLKAPFN